MSLQLLWPDALSFLANLNFAYSKARIFHTNLVIYGWIGMSFIVVLARRALHDGDHLSGGQLFDTGLHGLRQSDHSRLVAAQCRRAVHHALGIGHCVLSHPHCCATAHLLTQTVRGQCMFYGAQAREPLPQMRLDLRSGGPGTAPWMICRRSSSI